MGGKGSGPRNLSHLSTEQKQRRRLEMARSRWERIKHLDTEKAKRKLLQQEQSAKRKARRATPGGRKEWLSDRRTRVWWQGMRASMRTAAKARGLDVSPEMTSEWLREQFKRQQGRCFYTGIPFRMVDVHRYPWRPSIDRLDSSKGYEPSNVVLCLTAINYLKNDYALDEFLELLEDIRTAV